MKTTTVGEVQKNFSRVLRNIWSGEKIIVTRRGIPIARIEALGPKAKIDWPDFYDEAIEIEGKPISEVIVEGREDRF